MINNDNYFLLGSLIENSDPQTKAKNIYNFILQKFVINSIVSLENDSNILKSTSLELNDLVNMVSCFETSLKNIVCFYSNFTKIDNIWYPKYIIIAYDNNLLEKNIIKEISPIDKYIQIFLKCLHYKDEAGIFFYYYYYEKNYYPTFLFQNLTTTEFIDSLDEIKLSEEDKENSHNIIDFHIPS